MTDWRRPDLVSTLINAEDVRKFNAASVLGREGVESIAKGVRQRQQGNSTGRNQPSQNSFERTHTDMNPKPPSQGVRSIYKRSGR